jgi:hypothetical protein
MYNYYFPPLPLQQNAKQTAVTSQIESYNDFELEESSDNKTQEPVHEWQFVDKTKKMKREQTHTHENKTQQTYISDNSTVIHNKRRK